MAIPARARLTQAGGLPVLVLKEGSQRTLGREAQKANIMAAKTLAETIRSSLGPKGMDKMLVSSFGDVTLTNDGATILKEMDVQHPAAKMLVEVAKAQDSEVGDGTTTAVVLAGELLRKAEELLDQDVHATIIVDGYEKAYDKAIESLNGMALDVDPMDKGMLVEVAKTSLIGKAVTAGNVEKIAELAVESVLQVAEKVGEKFKVDLDNIKVEKKEGESLNESILIKGILLDKEVVHPGMPKVVKDAKIALLDCPLEIEKTEISAKINITSPDQMRSFLEEESQMLKKMVNKIASVKANVVVCQKGIDDEAQHFLAKKGIMAVRRAKRSDMEKLARASGGRIATSIVDLTDKDLGEAELVEERTVGKDKMTFIEGCKNPKAVTVLLRGGSKMMVDEAERSFHDAICVVRNMVQEPKIVAGGGAPEAYTAYKIRQWASSLSGREQLAALAFAEALESIPATLAENAGLSPVDVVVDIRSSIEKGMRWAGVDVFQGKVEDMYKLKVLEPLSIKIQAVKSAKEAATMILRIDDIIAAAPPKPEKKLPKPEEEGVEEY